MVVAYHDASAQVDGASKVQLRTSFNEQKQNGTKQTQLQFNSSLADQIYCDSFPPIIVHDKLNIDKQIALDKLDNSEEHEQSEGSAATPPANASPESVVLPLSIPDGKFSNSGKLINNEKLTRNLDLPQKIASFSSYLTSFPHIMPLMPDPNLLAALFGSSTCGNPGLQLQLPSQLPSTSTFITQKAQPQEYLPNASNGKSPAPIEKRNEDDFGGYCSDVDSARSQVHASSPSSSDSANQMISNGDSFDRKTGEN